MEGQHVPLEIIEHILSFALEQSQQHEGESTLLACALVCKAWLSPARRHLFSLAFPTGKVPIEMLSSQAIIDFANLLHSPLCTFDLGYIKTLVLQVTKFDFHKKPSNMSLRSFFAPLSALEKVTLPSLRGLVISILDFAIMSGKDDNFPDSLPPAIFTQIKTLEIGTIFRPEFVQIAGIIHLCPSLEAVTIYPTGYPWRPNGEKHRAFHPPPKSLGSLSLDVVVFQYMARWFMTCHPNHTSITTLIIDNFRWNDRYCCDLWQFLDKIGPNLEVFEVYFSMSAYGYHTRGPVGSVLNRHVPPLNRFARNISLKRFNIGAPVDIIAQFLPFFFEPAHFAPQLEILDVYISSLLSHLLPLLGELAPLDECLCSRPLLTRAVFSGNIGLNFCDEVESLIKKSLPRCGEKGIIEFRRPTT